MKPKLVVAGVLLAVAILAFASIGTQDIPVSATRTLTRESIEALFSKSPYMATNTLTYTTTTLQAYTQVGGGSYCPPLPPGYPVWGGDDCVYYYQTVTTYVVVSQTAKSSYLTQSTSTIGYLQTLTSSFEWVSTSIMPAYSSLGLTYTGLWDTRNSSDRCLGSSYRMDCINIKKRSWHETIDY